MCLSLFFHTTVEAQRDFHKIQGNLKVVTVPTPTMPPTTADATSATVRGRQTSSVEDDPSHHLFTVVVPRRTLRPQETHQQSPGDGDGQQQRFPMTSSTDVTSGSTVTWTTSTGTRFSTASGSTTTEMITRPTIPASKGKCLIMLMPPNLFERVPQK